MEHRLGTILFLPKLIDIGSSTSSNFEGAQFDLEGIWAKIESIQLPSPTQFQPTLPTLSLSPSEEAKAATSKNNGTQFVGVILLIAAVALVGLQPLLWFVSVGLVWVAWSKAFGGPEVDKGHWQKRFTAVEKKWHDELIAWQKRCGFEELYKCKNKLDSANQEYKDLHGEFQRRLTEHKQNFHASQIRFFLDGYRIRKVKIKGIGAAKEAALASYGIETAADVTSQAVLSVPGFGVVNSKPLLEWRAKLERQFVPAKRSNSNEQLAINKLHREFAEQAAKLRNTLSAGPTNLNSIIQTIRKRTKAVDPVLVRIHKERCQLETDMKFLFITSPVQTTYNSAYTYTPPPSARPQTKPPKSGYGAAQSPRSGKWTSGKISSPSCPQCGDRMVRRTARRGRNAGGNFWGCSQYPSCRGTRPI